MIEPQKAKYKQQFTAPDAYSGEKSITAVKVVSSSRN